MSCFMLQCAESFKTSGYFTPEWALESQMLRDVEQKEGPGQQSIAIVHNFRLYLESNRVWKCVPCEVPTEAMTLSQDHVSWDTFQCVSAQSCTIASWYVLVRECAHWKTHLASFRLASQAKVDKASSYRVTQVFLKIGDVVACFLLCHIIISSCPSMWTWIGLPELCKRCHQDRMP